MTFQEEMAQYDETWGQTEAAGQLTVFTDGTHQAKVHTCRIVEHPDFGWQWEIGVSGTDDNTGQPASMRKWHNLPPNDEGFKFVKGDAETLGYDGETLSGLERWCEGESAIGAVVEIFVKSKPSKDDPNRTFSNLYFNRLLGKGEPNEQFVPAAADDDDIPF